VAYSSQLDSLKVHLQFVFSAQLWTIWFPGKVMLRPVIQRLLFPTTYSVFLKSNSGLKTELAEPNYCSSCFKTRPLSSHQTLSTLRRNSSILDSALIIIKCNSNLHHAFLFLSQTHSIFRPIFRFTLLGVQPQSKCPPALYQGSVSQPSSCSTHVSGICFRFHCLFCCLTLNSDKHMYLV